MKVSQLQLGRRVLILSPHYDDIVLSLGGSIDAICKAREVYVCNIFSKTSFTHWGIGSINRISRFRLLEDKKALRDLNIKRIDLDFYDWNSSRLDGASVVERCAVIKRLTLICEKLMPTSIIGPLGIGDDPDHSMLSDISNYLHQSLDINLYQYVDLPYALSNDVPEGLITLDPDLGLKKTRLKAYKSQFGSTMIDNIINYCESVGGEQILCKH